MAKSKFKGHNPKKEPPPACPPDKLPLPNATSAAFRANGSNCQNVGLVFERYLRFVENRDCDWDMGTYNTGTKKLDTAKSWNLNEIAKAQDQLKTTWADSLPAKAITRWKETVESQNAHPFSMTPTWRFVAGLGDKTALEVGFTFHRIYGYPIIPGSALKGLARAAALWDIAEKLDVLRLSLSQVKDLGDKKSDLQKLDNWLLSSDEEMAKQKKFDLDEVKREQATRFRRIFGTQHAAGEAMFFEAVPTAAPILEVDIMNVHYPDYYGESAKEAKNTPPSDNQNPKPIPFLTVGQTPFWFAIGWRGIALDEALRDQAVVWLKAGLKNFGIGAKTSVGYGYFEEIE